MTRILFVDDEPRVLDGLARMLRARRGVWTMSFALGGEVALQRLDAETFDVIVSDLRMPDVDGLSVLTYARDHQPGAVRIALSGQTDIAMLTQTVSIVHQLLAKPCDAATLVTVIERIVSVQTLLWQPDLRCVVGQLGELPVLPCTYARFADALDDPEVPMGQIVEIVKQDVALAARCLQLANSAYFGARKRVETLHQAVSFLGTAMLHTLVLSSAAFSAFTPSSRLTHTQLEGIQRHSAAVASVARHLLDDPELGQQAFMAGMLHDIGRLVLATSDPHDVETLRLAWAEGADPADPPPGMCDATVTHAEIGAYLLGVWGLPYPIVEAVALHHHAERARPRSFDVLSAVYAAEALIQEHLADEAQARREIEAQLLAYLSTINPEATGAQIGAWLAEFRARAPEVLGTAS